MSPATNLNEVSDLVANAKIFCSLGMIAARGLSDSRESEAMLAMMNEISEMIIYAQEALHFVRKQIVEGPSVSIRAA